MGLVSVRGRMADEYSDEYRDACEGRVILAMPLDQRRREIEMRANKRGGGDPRRAAAIKSELERVVTEEWRFARESREAKAAA